MPSITPTERISARYCRLSLMNFISIILRPERLPVCFSSAMRSARSRPAFSSPDAALEGWFRYLFSASPLLRLMGTVSSVFGLKLVRLGLGLSEGPCPVGLASTINNWFPPKEKATATGVYIAATMFAPIIVPPLAVWIAVTGAGGGSFSPLLFRDRSSDSVVPVGEVKARGKRIRISKRTGRD